MAGDEDRRDEGEGFLAGWSRRKRAAARREAAEPDTPEAAPPETAPESLPDAAEPEVDEDYIAALPPIDEITGETDLEPFLKLGVPKDLRNAAMRKVWLANALIRNHDDPAVDYAWDWNAPEGVPGAGGALSGEGVSKMVRDLFEPVTKTAEVDVSDASGAEDETPAEEADPGPDPAAAGPDPTAGADGIALAETGPGPAPEETSDDARERPGEEVADARSAEAPPDAPPRRHGGALPR